MSLRRPLDRLVSAASAHPVRTLAVVLLLALAGGALGLGLKPSSGVGTLVGGGSATARATEQYYESFGDEAVIVLVKEELPNLLNTPDLGRLIKLEGCLGGNVPKGKKPYGPANGPCAKLAESRPARVVYGPGTFLFHAANAVADQLGCRLKGGEERGRAAQFAAAAAAKRSGRNKASQSDASEDAGRVSQ